MTKTQKEALVKVRLFRDNVNYKDDVLVSVNGKSWLIRRGVDVEVPQCVAEVLENSARQERITQGLISRLEEEFLTARTHL